MSNFICFDVVGSCWIWFAVVVGRALAIVSYSQHRNIRFFGFSGDIGLTRVGRQSVFQFASVPIPIEENQYCCGSRDDELDDRSHREQS